MRRSAAAGRWAACLIAAGAIGAASAAPGTPAGPDGGAATSVAAGPSRPDPQQLALGDPARKGRQAPVQLDGITDTATGELVSPSGLARRLVDVRVLFVGEEHTNGEFHRVQLRVIEALRAAGRRVILGLEMFPWTTTTPLERWSRGELTEARFLDESQWYEAWAHHWNAYRDIFLYARDHGLRLVGINAPREVVRSVRANGLDSLDAATRARLPPRIDLASEEHRTLVRAYFDPDDPLHSKLPPAQAEALYQAQVTWDAAMGWNAGQALSVPADPREIVVVLVGAGHVAYGLGAERQLAPHFAGRIASLIPVPVRDADGRPVPSVNAAYANYLWGVPWTAQPAHPVLGVSLMGRLGRQPTQVIQVDAGSTAEQAGIQVGDVLRELDGTTLDDGATLQRKLGDYRWGDDASLLIERDGKPRVVQVVFRRRG